MQERRRQQRIETNEVAYIFGDGSSICCRVVDLTDHGAAIELPLSAGHNMRDRFKLMIAKDRVERNCRIIWRSGSCIGVEFTN
ncbi:PilZ domain-containing protein [Bradyrhizobium sp. 956_D2_N1_5]|uniref:PilZ domain-containing protein n=1 Tax=unclassified Bradyrhizobium TaxID=2631580 RepID=UPI003F254E7A